MTPTAMIHFDRWSDGLRFPLTIVRGERRFSAHGSCPIAPPTPAFERVEHWTICARDRAEAVRTIDYHFGSTLVRYELGEGRCRE